MTTYAITGATGFVGSALTASLMKDGHHVVRIGRSSGHASPVPRLRNVTWDPAAGRLDPAGLEGVDAVVHLAGESVAGGRWTTARKTAIRQSRVQGTTLLARTLAGMQRRPAVLVSASAIFGAPDRAASYPSNAWEYPVRQQKTGYTYFFPLDESMVGREIEVILLGMKGGGDNLQPAVWLTARELPFTAR